jgi:hypothetical protein
VAGGAIAAGGGLNAKQKKEVKKIAKSFQGKGPQGAPGPPGANGKDGANGTNGTNGKDGAPGPPGKSISARPALPTECEERGGAVVEDEAAPPNEIEVCAGKEGEEGSPWTAGGTLPGPPVGEEEQGATETGDWAFTQNLPAGTKFFVPISFSIPLPAKLKAAEVHWQGEANFEDFDGAGAEEVGCKGAFGVPLAPTHSLCVYEGPATVHNAKFLAITTLSGEVGNPNALGVNRSGGLLVFEVEAAGIAEGSGAFAVTGF